MKNYFSKRRVGEQRNAHLHCLNCGANFTSVHIEAGAVQCPSCHKDIFRFVAPDEKPPTKEQFLSELQAKRGRQAVQRTKEWMRGGDKPLLLAGALVALLWPQLAETLEVKEPE